MLSDKNIYKKTTNKKLDVIKKSISKLPSSKNYVSSIHHKSKLKNTNIYNSTWTIRTRYDRR